MKSTSLFSKSTNNPSSLDGWSALVPILFDLICGLLLIILGNIAMRVTAYVLSGVMVCVAVWRIISYFRATPMQKITGSLLATGLAILVAGILLACNPDYLKEFLPFIWGLALLYGAFQKIQYAFDEKAVHIEKWWIMLIFAAFSLIIGVLSLLNPAFLGDKREVVIGILLIAEAILDVVVFVMISRALKKCEPHAGDAQAPSVPQPSEPAPEESAGESAT